MRFFLVDVKSITPSKPVEQFDKAEVEKLADSILECNGLSKPLILKPTGPESYVVIQGDMEFHAAVRAREKDPRKGEMVNAFVISPKAEEIVLNQLQTLQNPVLTPPSDHVIKPTEKLSIQDDIRHKVDKIGEKEETVLNLLKLLIGRESGGDVTNLLNKIEILNQKIVNLENTFSQKIDQQKAAFRQLSDSINTNGVKGKKKPIMPIPILPDEQAFLDFLNDKEELGLPKISGIGPERTKAIISNRPYNSMNDVKEKLDKQTVKCLISLIQKKS